MIGWIGHPSPWRRAVRLGLVLLVALRLLGGQAALSAPAPGLVALCMGGEIVYVRLAGPDAPVDMPAPDPCPWMGSPPVTEPAGQPLLRPARTPRHVRWTAAAEPAGPAFAAANYSARAPPAGSDPANRPGARLSCAFPAEKDITDETQPHDAGSGPAAGHPRRR